MDKVTLARLNMILGRGETPGGSNTQLTTQTSLIEPSKIEKIVDYSFERNEKSNVLAIHPTNPLIAYLINIQRPQMISKGWSSGIESLQSPSSSSINGQQNNIINNQSHLVDRNKTVSIRIIDYETRQRCLAKGIYHARPADCVFTINSLQCNQANVLKFAVVDRLSNIYLYNLSYFIDDLTATRVAVIRGPAQNMSPYESISLVWCPFVPCEDFDDGDGGLRLALATNSKLEIFAIDRLQGKTGELQRSELKGAYKCIPEAHKTDIVSLSISPDCSTVSAAALDNRVTFFSSDIDNGVKNCIHNWEASITDGSSISKLFFLDDYPKLLEDSAMKFWGAAFIGTRSGQMLLVDLRTWSVYQRMSIDTESTGRKNFDYRIDLTSRNIVAMNANQCFIVQIKHDYSNLSSPSRIFKINRLDLHNPIYSFVIKLKSPKELELFTISAYSLERYTINLDSEPVYIEPPLLAAHVGSSSSNNINNIISTNVSNTSTSSNINNNNNNNNINNKMVPKHELDANQMDRLVEALFTKLNTAFSQGLDEFLSDVKCEVNTLCRDVRKLQQQLQELRQK